MAGSGDFEARLAAAKTVAAARDLFAAETAARGYSHFDATALSASMLSTPRRAARYFVSSYFTGDAWAYLPAAWPGDDEVTARVARSSRPVDYLAALREADGTASVMVQRGLLKVFGVKRAWLFPHNTLGELRMVTCYITEARPDLDAHFAATRDSLFSLSAVFIDRLDELHRERDGDARPFLIGKLPVELTQEEWACFVELARGKTNAEIAAELGLSENTIKFHLKKVYRKLGVRSRSEAVAVALDHSIG